MNNFLRKPSQLKEILLLLDSVVGFRTSREFKSLRDYELDIPGVVAATFAEYLATTLELARNNPQQNLETVLSSAVE
jgi:hypothetical protein